MFLFSFFDELRAFYAFSACKDTNNSVKCEGKNKLFFEFSSLNCIFAQENGNKVTETSLFPEEISTL